LPAPWHCAAASLLSFPHQALDTARQGASVTRDIFHKNREISILTMKKNLQQC
jgi:hypothetical protein